LFNGKRGGNSKPAALQVESPRPWSLNPKAQGKFVTQAAELEAVLAERTQQMSEAETTLKLKEMEFERRVTKLQREHAVKVATVLHQVAAVVPACMSPDTAVVPAGTSPDTAAAAQGTAYHHQYYCHYWSVVMSVLFSQALLWHTYACRKKEAENQCRDANAGKHKLCEGSPWLQHSWSIQDKEV